MRESTIVSIYMSNKTMICDFCKKEYRCSNWKWSHRKSVYSNHKQYCSKICEYASTNREFKKIVNCKNCNKEFLKKSNQIKKCPNNFCNRSCAVTFNNKNKKHGNRRSKLEIWLEDNLKQIYPKLKIYYSKKDIINSELDIYIPSIKIAFEINGIFHYKPIYGKQKLKQIQNNDKIKIKECLNKGINLYIINTTKQLKFNPKTSYDYLNEIINKINNKLEGYVGNAPTYEVWKTPTLLLC